ncbi:carbohydrate-binding module family 18 protein [Parathielavia appendiculata]|uniref:Carbohydrate-binding module family 18 protein n=1 Tax=Parathielavia appendiculata TaxID=2587402 RepID=A0AAN6Z5G5_9PEZI|nr:carbohydrate-binding module family 18 protein [Parathielavia appendiculata]
MVALLLTRGLLFLALGLTHQAVAACTRSITAKSGDTCATLAAQAGITVTQFLRSNPSVTSCSQLVVGGSYCVEGTADSTPTSSSAPVPVSTSPSNLQVSTDGSCGQGVTCAGSRFGDCCSAHGFCGSTVDYCGDGCHAAFGVCGAGAGESSQAPGPSVTVTVTTVTAITRTSLVYQTSTITNVVTQTRTASTATVTTVVTQTRTTGTAIVTRIIQTTATVETTATVPTTATSIVSLTSIFTSVRTSTTTSTSIRTSTSTTTRTVNITGTSISISTVTSVVTSTRIVTSAACNTTPTRTTARITTSTTTKAPSPRPTLPGTPSNCRNYDIIEDDDNCRSIATRNDLTLLEFYEFNPSVSPNVLSINPCTPDLIELWLSGLCQINCDGLWEGYYVCVGR